MAVSLTPAYVLVLVVSAFAMPLIFLAWIRNTKRFARPPTWPVLKAFAWGAVISVLIALVIETLLTWSGSQFVPLTVLLSKHFSNPEWFVSVILVAPFVEEAAKGLSARTGLRATRAVVDGLVFGAAAGLGFSATENLFYGLGVLPEAVSPVDPLMLIAIRSFSSSLLHGSATAVLGYGLAKGWLSDRTLAFLPYYLVAVAMHATFNFLDSLSQLYSDQIGSTWVLIGFAAAILFAVTAMTVVRYALSHRRPRPTR